MKNKKNLKRVFIDFKQLNNEILELLVSKYPYGYRDKDIVSFKNQESEMVDCVKVKTEDILYLVEANKRLLEAMEDYYHDDDYDLDIDLDNSNNYE